MPPQRRRESLMRRREKRRLKQIPHNINTQHLNIFIMLV
jgi:hypothetical protein